MTEKITIPISKELKQKLDEIIKETNFKSIQDYLLFLLKQLVSGTDKKAYTKEEEAGIFGGNKWNDDEKKAYTKEEEAELKQKLKDMGYV